MWRWTHQKHGYRVGSGLEKLWAGWSKASCHLQEAPPRIFRVSWHAWIKYRTLFLEEKFIMRGSFGWNVLENTSRRATQLDCVAPGPGYVAQSRRHNISDYTAIITGMATAHRANNRDVVAKEKLYSIFFFFFILGMLLAGLSMFALLRSELCTHDWRSAE